MDLMHLVDRLEELVASAQKMPIGNRAILDRRRLLDIIDQMRIAVPQEVREAQEIVAHREALRREAEEDGRILVAQAEERASRLVEAHEITAAAAAPRRAGRGAPRRPPGPAHRAPGRGAAGAAAARRGRGGPGGGPGAPRAERGGGAGGAGEAPGGRDPYK